MSVSSLATSTEEFVLNPLFHLGETCEPYASDIAHEPNNRCERHDYLFA
jgi:hypothetical protein